MAAQSNLRNMVLCLTAVCLVCAALLGCIYVVTEQPIKDAAARDLQAALSQVLPSDGEISTEAQFVTVDGVNYEYYTLSSEGQAKGWAIKSVVNGFGGALTVLVGMERDGVVHAAKVLSHSETPGLGAKCQTESSFIDQFKGFDSASRKLSVKKDGGDIDAITASTITSRAYTLAVANAAKVAAGLQDKEATK